MFASSKRIGAIIITVFLLIITNLVRSEYVIDTSFLPRALSLTFTLIISILLFIDKALIGKLNFWNSGLILFLVWNLASCIWSVSPSEALMQCIIFFLGIGVFLVVTFHDEPLFHFAEDFIKIQILVLLFSFIAGFSKIASLEFYDPYQLHPVNMNNNLFAAFLLLSLPLTLWGLKLFKGLWKALSLTAALLAVFFIVILQSRSAYIGLIFSVISLSAILLIRFRNAITRKNILTVAISLVVLTSGIWGFYQSLDGTRQNAFISKVALWKYIGKHTQDIQPETPDKKLLLADDDYPVLRETPKDSIPVEYFENVNTRLIFWQKSMGLISAHPILGVGTGNWKLNVASVTLPRNPDYTIRNYTYSQPHNEWIAFASELGIPGLLLALIFLAGPVLLALFLALFSRKRKIPVEAVVIACFLMGFSLFSLFDFPFRRVEHLVLFFALLAFLLKRTPFSDYSIKGISSAIPYRAVNVSVLSLLVIAAFVIGMRIRGEYNTLKIFRYEDSDNDKVITYCNKARSWFYCLSPNTLPVDWFKGVAEFRKNDAEKAVESFKSALRTAPYEVRVLNDYSVASFGVRNSRESIRALKTALILDPAFDEAKFNLSAVYFSMGNVDSALHYVNRCRYSLRKTNFTREIIYSAIP